MIPPPPRTTLFPYTTLFRSPRAAIGVDVEEGLAQRARAAVGRAGDHARDRADHDGRLGARRVVLVHRIVARRGTIDRKSTRLNSSHVEISYAVFCLKKKIFRPQPAPDVSYFQEVGQLYGYDKQVAAYDGTNPNSGAKVMYATEQNNRLWSALGGLGVSIGAGATTGLIVNANISAIRPFLGSEHIDWNVQQQSEEFEAENTEAAESAETDFFFNDTATTEIYTLSLHDALPI